MGDHPRGGQWFAVDAVVPQDNRMLGAEAVLPHFWTHDVARANSLASFAAGAADPNTYCGQPCARVALLATVERHTADNLIVQPQNPRPRGRYRVRAPSIVRAESVCFRGHRRSGGQPMGELDQAIGD